MDQQCSKPITERSTMVPTPEQKSEEHYIGPFGTPPADWPYVVCPIGFKSLLERIMTLECGKSLLRMQVALHAL